MAVDEYEKRLNDGLRGVGKVANHGNWWKMTVDCGREYEGVYGKV